MNARRLLIPLVALTLLLTVALPVLQCTYSDDSYGAVDGSSDYYYTQLDADEKTIYQKIVEFAPTIDPSSEEGRKLTLDPADYTDSQYPSVTQGERAFRAFYCDHPEMFWITSSLRYEFIGSDLHGLIFSVTADTTILLDKQRSDVNKAVEVIKIDGEFRYDKVKQIHDWIVSNSEYDTAAVEDKGAVQAHNIYGIFVLNKAVCEGYARAFEYLCQMNGIPCIVSSGDGVSGKDTEAHMWNYIQMEDGKYYCMDVTWDDPISSSGSDTGKVHYDYFLKGTETVNSGKKFTESHVDTTKKDYGFNIPELSADPYRFQPGATEHLDAEYSDKDASGAIAETYTLTVANIDDIRQNIGIGGSMLIKTKDFLFKFTCDELKTVKEKLTTDGVDTVVFGGTLSTAEVKAIDQLDFTKEVKTFSPSISTGDVSSLGLGEMTVGIAADMTPIDLNAFMYAWEVSDPQSPQKIKAEYKDGYEYFTVTSLGTYTTGNNPITPVLGIPFLAAIGMVVLAVILILLIIKRLLVGRKIKKMARTMAKSKRNMQHYGQLYEDRELSSKERKAYLKARKIYRKNHKKDD